MLIVGKWLAMRKSSSDGCMHPRFKLHPSRIQILCVILNGTPSDFYHVYANPRSNAKRKDHIWQDEEY